MKRNIFLLLLITGCLFLGQQVLAQPKGIGISPVTFELTGNPGDVLINQIKIYNLSEDSRVGVKMEVENITPTGEVGHVVAEPQETETYSLMRWIKTDPEELILEPKEQKFVTFTISIPNNAEPGGHYGTVLASTLSSAGPEMTGAAIAQRVGTLVLLSVAGEVEENLTVKDFSVPNYSEYGPIPFTIRFENKGTVHVKPRGYITVTNWLGKKIADVEFPQQNVLPGAVRKIEVAWQQKWLWAAKYTATLHGSYGVSNTPFTPNVITFWAFSWKAALLILAVVILFVLSRKRWMAAFKILIRGEKYFIKDK